MVALVTLNERSKVKLIHLLNNLNLGIAAADFGTAFVNLLDTGTTDTSITTAREQEIGHLLNNLNLGTARLKFGTLMQHFLHSKAEREAAASAITPRQKAELIHVLNNLNLGLSQIGFGNIVAQTIDAVVAGITPPVAKTITAAADKATATGGDKITFASMFTLAGGLTVADLDFAVAPSAAGTVDAAGALTLADTASGKVSVTASANVGITGVSPATFNITAVTAKP